MAITDANIAGWAKRTAEVLDGWETSGIPTTAGASTVTFASVASSATAVTLLAANTSRKAAMVFNDSTAVLYLAEFPTATATASASNYTVQVAPGGFYSISPEYNGLVQGIWASANGFARVTEH